MEISSGCCTLDACSSACGMSGHLLDVTLHIENLVDLVFGSHAKCSTIFHQEAALSRMGIAALAGIFAIVLAGDLFIVASLTKVPGPCSHGCGLFEKVNFVAVIQPIFAGTDGARLFPTWLCTLMGFAHPLVTGTRCAEEAKELEVLGDSSFQQC